MTKRFAGGGKVCDMPDESTSTTEIYPNAPLVELVAEVYWLVTDSDEFLDASLYDRFADEIAKFGFTHSEKLIPDGMPELPGQVKTRFRSVRGKPPIYQIGPGVLSANGLPPTYSNWNDFAPFLFRGIDALQAAAQQPIQSFEVVKLRYIDAFKARHLRGKTSQQFIEEVLGFTVVAPSIFSELSYDKLQPSTVIQLRQQLTDSGQLSMVVGEALVDGLSAVVVDLSVQYNAVALTDLSSRFNTAHSVTNRIFETITGGIRDLMRETPDVLD